MSAINKTIDGDVGLRAYLAGFAKGDYFALSGLQRVDWMKLSNDPLNQCATKILTDLLTDEVVNILSGVTDMRALIGQVLSDHEEEDDSLSVQEQEDLTKAIQEVLAMFLINKSVKMNFLLQIFLEI